MNKGKFWIPVLVGLMIGQLFADNERPFGLANTVRFGYSDNLYQNESGKNSPFVTDIIDLSFRAALSDRTDLMVKSQLTLWDDQSSAGNQVYPNLYAMLNHNISTRLLLRLSEYYRSGDQTGQGSMAGSEQNKRFNYFYNAVGASTDYVLTGKDRLEGSVSEAILRHDKEIEELDYTTVGGGVAWKRELIPQRTQVMLNLHRSNVNYDNRPKDTEGVVADTLTNFVYAGRSYLDNEDSYDQTDLSVGLSHTFNQEWQGNVEAGVSYVQPNSPRSEDWRYEKFLSGTNVFTSYSVGTNKVDNAPHLDPLLRAGLVYTPSPRTRLTGDFSLTHKESDDSGYNGQNTAELRFGAQHDITAKLMAKATARFANTKYDAREAETSNKTERTEDRMTFEFRLTYKLNRINFLEAGVRHSEMSGDAESWKENRADIGWRVELN